MQQKSKKELSPLQVFVTQQCGTEPPFQNEFWDNKREGIYVDVVSGEPLFCSKDKFDSGTGWPSFTKPLVETNIVEQEDNTLMRKRTEVRSKEGDSHLGHVFPDGPGPSGIRYCINSASLRFIPIKKLAEEGYGEYLSLFEELATLAGGCFWGVEEILRKLSGVLTITAGYTGGILKNPTYEDVCTGKTGHAEAVQVTYDPSKTSYEEIVRYFFRLHDPTMLDQQGNDKGSQYRSVIFWHNESQKKIALKVKEAVDQSGKWKKPVVTSIIAAQEFYPAEDYHQDYLQKNPRGYTCHYLRD